MCKNEHWVVHEAKVKVGTGIEARLVERRSLRSKEPALEYCCLPI